MSTINVNNVLPESFGTVNINGANVQGGGSTVYLADASMPSTNQSVIVGAVAAPGLSGDSNVAIGYASMNDATTASGNVCVGAGSGQSLTDGTGNTLIGNGSGNNIINPVPFSSGFMNTCVGNSSGSNITSGYLNTFIGHGTGTLTSNITGYNLTCIGQSSSPSANNAINEITLGDTQINVLRCNTTSITSLSDARDKKEITELSAGLDFVKTLKPVEFVWDDRDEKGKHDIKDFGFIAQDLKKSQEDANLADTLKLVYESNPEKLEASYGKLIPILVKAIQELSEEVKQLKNK